MKKSLIILITLIVLSGYQSPVQEKKLKFEFTASEMGVIYRALQEIPFKESAPVIATIEVQYAKQVDTTKKK